MARDALLLSSTVVWMDPVGTRFAVPSRPLGAKPVRIRESRRCRMVVAKTGTKTVEDSKTDRNLPDPTARWHHLEIMKKYIWISLGIGIGLLAGTILLVPLLNLFFPGFTERALPGGPDELDQAGWAFSLSLALLGAALPISIFVMEKGLPGRYAAAIGKSLLLAMLAFGIGWLYCKETLASRERLARKMGQPSIGAVEMKSNPMTSIVLWTGLGLLLVGPVDLAIARMQRRKRNPGVMQPAELHPSRIR